MSTPLLAFPRATDDAGVRSCFWPFVWQERGYHWRRSRNRPRYRGTIRPRGSTACPRGYQPRWLVGASGVARRCDENVVVVHADVSKQDDVRQMIAVAVEQYGRLDIAVANAGIIPLASVVEATPEDWDEVMAIDGRGMFLTCKYAIEQMLINGGGSVVCLSSISGVAGQARQSTYGPAKFVASGLAKHLAVEWAKHGIRVNAVAPGTINTERVQRLPEEPGGPEYLEVVKAAHPMGRLGEPSEVAEAILFLASPGRCCRSMAASLRNKASLDTLIGNPH